jgi:hypothetical protein
MKHTRAEFVPGHENGIYDVPASRTLPGARRGNEFPAFFLLGINPPQKRSPRRGGDIHHYWGYGGIDLAHYISEEYDFDGKIYRYMVKLRKLLKA